MRAVLPWHGEELSLVKVELQVMRSHKDLVYRENRSSPRTEYWVPSTGVKGAGFGQGAIPCDLVGAIRQVGCEPG